MKFDICKVKFARAINKAKFHLVINLDKFAWQICPTPSLRMGVVGVVLYANVFFLMIKFDC